MIQFIGLIVALVFVQVSSVYADDACSHWSAKVTSMQGVVEIRKHSTQGWIPAKLHDRLCANDSLRTATHSRATIHIQEETFMVLKERSTVSFSSNQENEDDVFSQLLKLFNGEAYFRSRRPRELEIDTPFVNAMHEGTEFLVKVNQDSTQVVVFDGIVVASNALGQVSIAEGQSALTLKGQAPAIGPRIELRDAVQWTLYYPPVIDYTSTRQNPSYSALKPVFDRFQSNDLAGAFEYLDNVNETERNADYQIFYASLLLTVGQVEQAQQHLNLVQEKPQKNANILALRSIIALAKSDQQQALKLAEQAQQVNPQAAAPNIALSYAYQSLFDIDKALNSAKQAAHADPNNGLAWARVAEMELATGNVDASMEAASKAQALNPKLAKTNTVLGFARLASLDLSEAEQSFRTAIKRDPSDPLARLGLGLARIRQGHIKSGTKEMETAANLDPDSALIRSYLGKAYYEQRRGDIASTEYAIAKQLDPNDPTPWFYDAIYKQTVNRPVEALHAMQKAIELNDNRAVYRSKLLLDEDLAARSAAMGRIYNDLGFQRRGLFEGWKSVNNDPGNFSGHRLLADNYSALPRHELARVSELLQSQLLQPINVTPVQPQLAESNLLILDGLGPANSSFNEFNPMFARNRFALQASGVYGSNDTWGNEVTQSGLWNQFSYSLGQFHFETDGIRENNDLEQDIYNVFAQTEISPKINLQAEYRHTETKHGDLNVNFDLTNFDSAFRRRIIADTARFGGRYTVDPYSKVLVSLIYRNADTQTTQEVFSNDENTEGYLVESQYLFSSEILKVTLGGGYDRGTLKTECETSAEVPEIFPGFCLTSLGLARTANTESDFNHSNGYIYSYIGFPKQVIWMLGFSFDSLVSDDLGDINQANPKIGMSWDITPQTTIRMAAFRALKRSLITNKTIEPTQVAGFNQFFDDKTGTESRRYGIAIDHKFSTGFFGGIEASRRDLRVPSALVGTHDEQEDLYRFYINWTPIDNVALKLNYEYERFKSDTGTPPTTRTHTLPINMSYFQDNGFFTSFGITYVNQEVGDSDTTMDRFVLFDVGLGYRLPKRYGIVRFGVRNILDKEFNYQGSGSRTPTLDEPQPFFQERTIFGQITLAF